jgi:hypothetical protein
VRRIGVSRKGKAEGSGKVTAGRVFHRAAKRKALKRRVVGRSPKCRPVPFKSYGFVNDVPAGKISHEPHPGDIDA